MKNPLNRRFMRELKEDYGKYLVIFLFLAGMIALVSGFLVANDSMVAAYEESFDKYQIEDGNFELSEEADPTLLTTLEQEEVSIYKNYYLEEETEEIDSTLRIFANRTEVDRVCLMEGELPRDPDEIAIDRMYADNNQLSPGDTLTVGGSRMTICGLVALSDYSALFSKTSDLMFDAVKFGTAIVTQDGFDRLGDTHLHYSYSWIYDDQPADDIEAKTKADDFLKAIAAHTVLVNYIPQYLNQAIHFTGDDLTGDNRMFTVFLYLVVLIIAFVIAIITGSTIQKEAGVIGTLRASGYTKGELVRHYMVMPVLVMLFAALIGNILGYTCLKEYMAAMYYGSYSLPTYVTRWNADAFLKTTVVPIGIMILLNLGILIHRLALSPLRFLRRDLKKRSKKKAFRLNTKLHIFHRFRLRVIFQNIPNYLMILLGIFFANFILLFGLMFGPLLDKFSDDIVTHMIAQYQYVLKTPVQVEDSDAEAYCISTLKTEEGKLKSEEVMIYGISGDSEYIKMDTSDHKTWISSAYAKKYNLKAGDTIVLDAQYEDRTYEFQVDGIYEYPSSIAVFIGKEQYVKLFDKDEAYFNGYFSETPLDDLDEKLVATVITQDDLTKTSRQLKVSMGDAMQLLQVFGILMFLLLIYLLSKVIIEKNVIPISMAKILGYNQNEINRLYILPTTMVVLAALILTMPCCSLLMEKLCVMVFSDYSGYFPYYVPTETFIKMFVLGTAAYVVIAIFQMYKVKKIPMGEALKNVE